MAASAKGYLISILLFALLAYAWVLPSVTTPRDILRTLSPRQDVTQPNTGCGSRCMACAEGVPAGSCGGRVSVKRNLDDELFWAPLHEVGAAIGNSTHETDKNHLQSRALEDLTAATVDQVATYLNRRQTSSGAFDLNTQPTSNSLTRQFEFSRRRRGLVMGFTQSGYLTGCTVLTVASRRAVYMGHFWQNLGFENYADETDIENGAEPADADFDRNVRNLIIGDEDLYRAQGPALDPSLYNKPDDNTYASIMTAQWPNGALVHPDYIDDMRAILEGLIPGVRVVIKPYLPISEREEEQLAATGALSVRGQCMFEYDPDADGQGNADWRLWYEQWSTRGTAEGQQNIE